MLDGAGRSSSERVAARAGIQPGDAILAFNDALVKFIELKSLVKKSDKTIALLIQRDAIRMCLPVQINWAALPSNLERTEQSVMPFSW